MSMLMASPALRPGQLSFSVSLRGSDLNNLSSSSSSFSVRDGVKSLGKLNVQRLKPWLSCTPSRASSYSIPFFSTMYSLLGSASV